jgi:hypothetical protein
MHGDTDPRSGRAARVREICTRRSAGHSPHRSSILLCHTGALAEWHQVLVLDVSDGVITLAVGDELQRFRNHDPEALAAAVAAAGPQAHLNTRFGYLFLASWPREAEAVFSLCGVDRDCPPCG